jgi:cell division transport system permease protein
VHVIAVVTIAIALFSAGLVRGAVTLVDRVVATLGSEVELTVYLVPGATEQDAAAVAEGLAKRAGASAQVVSSDEALKRLSSDLGQLGEGLAELPENPLPTSIELKLPRASREVANFEALAQSIRSEPLVAQVDYGEEAVQRLSSLSRALRLAGWVAFAVVALATIVIVAATLQLAIYARREEIEIQKLVGATNRFVKTPFLLEGFIQGFLGACVAIGALVVFSSAAAATLGSATAFLVGPGVDAALIDAKLCAELLGLGCALGLCGSFVAVGRFLRA